MNIYKRVMYLLDYSFSVNNARQHPFYSESTTFLNHKFHAFNITFKTIWSTILPNIIYTNVQYNGIYITIQVYIHIMEKLFWCCSWGTMNPYICSWTDSLILIPFTIPQQRILILTFWFLLVFFNSFTVRLLSRYCIFLSKYSLIFRVLIYYNKDDFCDYSTRKPFLKLLLLQY